MENKLLNFRRLYRTIRYLKYKQIYYQIYYRLRNKFNKPEYNKQFIIRKNTLSWQNVVYPNTSYDEPNFFTFLNKSFYFENKINWNFSAYGKLWTYNLNYFDFLNQKGMRPKVGVKIISDYIENDFLLKDGKEPYPTSLRGINWIKFLSNHNIENTNIDSTLRAHYEILKDNLEYHLLGNHLLENGFALLFGAFYFNDKMLYTKAKQILTYELNEQILDDGAHFELSPMYHQILLFRLLDCINLMNINKELWKEEKLFGILVEKAIKMVSWLETITFSNGNIPMVNDSTYDIAPSTQQLIDYALKLGLTWSKKDLSDSGYRMFKENEYELFIDVGNVGSYYQPGHVHSDTFNFELYVKGKPIIIDTGVSTYEKNGLRQQERETAAHNTVKIGNQEQTQVWGGFRVGRRAKIVNLEEHKNFVKATHDGYRHLGLMHTRSYTANAYGLIIDDFLDKETQHVQIAFFHFHPSIKKIEIDGNFVRLVNQNVNIVFNSALKIEMQEFGYALGFNKREGSHKILVYFHKALQTQISI